MKKSVLTTVVIVICVLLLGASAWMFFGAGSGLGYAHADQYTPGGATITSPVENLDVNWSAGHVTVEYHSGSEIIVSETASRTLADDERLMWWLDGSTLRIQYMKPGIRFRFNLNKALTVSLPEGMVLNTANVSVSSADVTVSGLAAGEVKLESSSGNIRGTVSAESVTVGSSSGDQDVTLAKDAASVKFSSSSGRIAASMAAAGTVSGTTSSGGISVTFSGSVDDLRLGSSSGSIAVEAAKAKKADVSATSGSVSVRLAAFEDLKIGTSSGDVTAALPEAPGFTCEVRTSSGDVRHEIAMTETAKNTYACGSGEGRCSISTSSGDVRIERAD